MPDVPRRGALFLALVVLAAAVSGCGPRSTALYEKVMGSPSYQQVTASNTRTREVRDGLQTRFILSATWLSAPWIASFSEEYSNIYYLDAARREQVISHWRGESESYVRFFVALFVPEETGNDLEKPETLWSLRLVRGDEKDFKPVYLRKTSLRPEETSRFFPYAGTWYRAYEVAFPKEALDNVVTLRAGTPRLKLVLSGVQGRAVLAWD